MRFSDLRECRCEGARGHCESSRSWGSCDPSELTALRPRALEGLDAGYESLDPEAEAAQTGQREGRVVVDGLDEVLAGEHQDMSRLDGPRRVLGRDSEQAEQAERHPCARPPEDRKSVV